MGMNSHIRWRRVLGMPRASVARCLFLPIGLILSLLSASAPVNAAGSVPPVRAQPGAPQATAPFFLDHDSDNYAVVPRIAVDASGGTHVVYYTLSSGTNKVFYAYCATACNQSASWGSVVIGTTGDFGGDVQIAVDPSNHPRILWRYLPVISLSVNHEFKYAACDANCLSPASWTVTTVETSGDFSQDTYGQSQFFALDHSGHPRFVFHDSAPADFVPATYYTYCDTACTSASNWLSTTLNVTFFNSVWLGFTPSNQPRVAYYATSGTFGGIDHLVYLECNAACNNASNWSTPLETFPIVSAYFANLGAQFAFHLNRAGQPRFLYYTGDLGSGNADNFKLFYAWCNSGCTSFGNWDRAYTGVPAGSGDGPDVAFDSADHPHIVYHNDQNATPAFSLGYGVCSAGCETHSPTWHFSYLDRPADIPPLPNLPGCSENFWYVKTSNALAIDPSDNPRAVYNVDNVQGGTCTAQELLNLVRFTMRTGLNPNPRVYIPLVER
jgi:hypothetical protein